MIIKFEQKVTFLIPVTWVFGLHYAGNIIHSPAKWWSQDAHKA